MTKKEAIKFLNDMAVYWEQQAVSTWEDSEYWASLYNQENCLQIKELLERDINDD